MEISWVQKVIGFKRSQGLIMSLSRFLIVLLKVLHIDTVQNLLSSY